jgi:hypothetical protein
LNTDDAHLGGYFDQHVAVIDVGHLGHFLKHGGVRPIRRCLCLVYANERRWKPTKTVNDDCYWLFD